MKPIIAEDLPAEYRIRELQRLLWRNHPQMPSTFSECGRLLPFGDEAGATCENLARGSGPCADCTEIELATIVGDKLARRYHSHVITVRDLESRMAEIAS